MAVLILSLDDLSNRAKQSLIPRRSHWAFSSLLIFKGPTSLLSSQYRNYRFPPQETTATMSLLANYKKTLLNFGAQCSEISCNGGIDRSAEFKSILEALETAFGICPYF